MMAQLMIIENNRSRLLKLTRKRNKLRIKLREHFSLPVSQRNYKDFEIVVDALDDVRKKIHELQTSKF